MTDVEALLRTLPRRIKVGAYDWRVILNDLPLDEIDKCGEADFEHHVINLWPANIIAPDHAVGIVFHELFHVFWDNADLQNSSKSDDQEEEIVVGFEHGFVSLFRDNPRLISWLRKGLKPAK